MLTDLTRRTMVLSALASLATPSLAASDPAAVMSRNRELRRGLTNSVSDVTMTINSGGREVTRKMRQFVLEVSGRGNQTINVFSSPADVQGISVLTHSALNGNDQQWLFLPSVGRVKRISSSNRSGAFVGSDFAYEDLSSFEVEKYSYTSAEDVTLGGKKAISVVYKPSYSGTGYTQLRAFLDPGNYQPLQIEYYN
ncbi:MAG: outer membrane lipoprotein-sorting protein, partial [Albidovulum sp.]|uniref:outer membrane lipoprotein-sorting protein n=1 Tax=Albidovulum sp. TaxID=1872424 RepID=UPI003CAEB69F